MSVINVKGKQVDADIAEELATYSWENERWTSDKLIASSPFRDDNAPSFFVNLSGEYAGTWGDSGAYDDVYSRGNFISLIGHLRGIGYEEAGEYLIDKYGALYEIEPDEPIRIRHPKISKGQRRRIIEANPITVATSPYLLTRGITEEVQKEYGIGYGDTARGYTAYPWHTPDGRLASIKYRSTRGKDFFYESGSTPIKRLVYGIDLAEESAVLVEGEIDVLSWAVAGISAVSVGGAYLSQEQADIIVRRGIRRLYLGGDNDEQGRKLNRQAERLLRGRVELFEIDYGKYVKDANDVLQRSGAGGLVEIFDNAKPVRFIRIGDRPG